MENENYPSLFIASDKGSNKSQKYYLNLYIADLILIVLGAGLTVYNFSAEESLRWIYVVSCIFLLAGIVITIILKAKEFENIWYQSRALAESCKTITWRYITCSEYFESILDEKSVNDRFLKRLEKLKEEFRELNGFLDSRILIKPLITERMVEIRKSSLIERKDYYLTHRILDQKKWYSTEAEKNKKKYNTWFFIVLVSQLLALGYVIILINAPGFKLNLVGLFTTISSSALSWLQLKKHQELKQAYTTTAQELNFIEATAKNIEKEEEFSKFVLDSENAISREHTTWLGQRRG